MLQPGDSAPDFELMNQDGHMVSLANHRGRTVVLYFYPRDDTPACTKEACSLQSGLPAIGAKGAVVLGVSPDSPESHRKFRGKYRLTFDLLSDASHAVIETWGAWGEKTLYGKKSVGVLRTTFIIGPDGAIKHVFRKVDTAAHADQILPKLG